jgi:hypothetical protein
MPLDRVQADPDSASAQAVGVGASPPVRGTAEPQDEAGLLYRAKRLAARDAQAALQLLESHAKYFPRGVLAEERDVLMVQLHRKLGHTAQAARLAAEFRARYPKSMYARTLDR